MSCNKIRLLTGPYSVHGAIISSLKNTLITPKVYDYDSIVIKEPIKAEKVDFLLYMHKNNIKIN